MADEYSTPETEFRANEYGINGLPTVTFDGNQNRVLGGSPDCQDRYREQVIDELALGSALALVASWQVVTPTLHFSATVINHSEADLAGVYLQFVIAEDLGSQHRFVVRDMLPRQNITHLASGEHVTLSRVSEPLEGVDVAKVHGVAYVQDPTQPEKVVLQAALAQAAPILQVQPTVLHFLVDPSDAGSPEQAVHISNGGDGALTWAAATDSGWLVAEPLSGTAPVSLTVAVDTSGLSLGQWYSGHVTLTASSGTYGSPQEVSVLLYYGSIDRLFCRSRHQVHL